MKSKRVGHSSLSTRWESSLLCISSRFLLQSVLKPREAFFPFAAVSSAKPYKTSKFSSLFLSRKNCKKLGAKQFDLLADVFIQTLILSCNEYHLIVREPQRVPQNFFCETELLCNVAGIFCIRLLLRCFETQELYNQKFPCFRVNVRNFSANQRIFLIY